MKYCLGEATEDRKKSRHRSGVGLNQGEGQEGTSQPEEQCLSPVLPTWLLPLPSAVISLPCLFQAGLVLSAFGPLGLTTCVYSLF